MMKEEQVKNNFDVGKILDPRNFLDNGEYLGRVGAVYLRKREGPLLSVYLTNNGSYPRLFNLSTAAGREGIFQYGVVSTELIIPKKNGKFEQYRVFRFCPHNDRNRVFTLGRLDDDSL